MTITIFVLFAILLLALSVALIVSTRSACVEMQQDTSALLGGANPSPPPIEVEAEIESRAPVLRARVAPASE